MVNVRVPTVEPHEDLQRDLNQTQNKGRQACLAGANPLGGKPQRELFDSAWEEIGKDVAETR